MGGWGGASEIPDRDPHVARRAAVPLSPTNTVFDLLPDAQFGVTLSLPGDGLPSVDIESAVRVVRLVRRRHPPELTERSRPPLRPGETRPAGRAVLPVGLKRCCSCLHRVQADGGSDGGLDPAPTAVVRKARLRAAITDDHGAGRAVVHAVRGLRRPRASRPPAPGRTARRATCRTRSTRAPS